MMTIQAMSQSDKTMVFICIQAGEYKVDRLGEI
jgi:hypothetical protein